VTGGLLQPCPHDRNEDRLCPGLTNDQDLTAQRNALLALGVEENQIFVDHGLTGANRTRHGLREAMAACRCGDTLVVTKLDRLARSLPDARDIADELTAKGVVLSLGGSTYDPTDPVGRLLFNVLGMVAEFEADLIRMRTREGIGCRQSEGATARQAAEIVQDPTEASSDAARRRRAHAG
jgi:DNA invertase Pin-like site-specific DNA recombinase